MLKPHKKKILFLYFELAGYVVACMEKLAAKYDSEVHVVRYPVNAVAPFKFNFSERIHDYARENYSNEQLISLVNDINPDFVYVCGWADKGYLAVCKSLKKRVPVVMTLDNPWLGTIKQRIASLFGPLYLHQFFTHCWVPGAPNAEYARRLGFKNDRLIQSGMYSADVDLFHRYYDETRAAKENKFPHRFIYVGRYTELKGIRELWQAFSSINESERKGWELWCLGKGELLNEFPKNEYIKDVGFVQPDQLKTYLADTGVFILPTHYEHWGVVVHEYAASGFPMICSTTTSAATTFLKEGENGYFCQPKNVESIRTSMLKIINRSDEQLIAMGKKSVELSKMITPDTWADTIMSLIK